MQSSSGRLPEQRTRRPLATLIPMAGRTGKLSPVQSPSCRHSSHIASLPGETVSAISNLVYKKTASCQAYARAWPNWKANVCSELKC